MGEDEYLELICVQNHPEYIDECINLLNSEWPRSKTARLVGIQQGSCEGFPTTLLLIDKSKNYGNGDKEQDRGVVVACCKVSPVSVYYPAACFVESVVVAKHLRGKGIGRIIMDKMENYVKCRGICTIYLTTHDQQGFYAKLGYSCCDPVAVYGGKCHNFGNNVPVKQSSSSQQQTQPVVYANANSQMQKMETLTSLLERVPLGQETRDVAKIFPLPLPLPPPPPLPHINFLPKQKLTKSDIIIMPQLVKATMRKELL